MTNETKPNIVSVPLGYVRLLEKFSALKNEPTFELPSKELLANYKKLFEHGSLGRVKIDKETLRAWEDDLSMDDIIVTNKSKTRRVKRQALGFGTEDKWRKVSKKKSNKKLPNENTEQAAASQEDPLKQVQRLLNEINSSSEPSEKFIQDVLYGGAMLRTVPSKVGSFNHEIGKMITEQDISISITPTGLYLPTESSERHLTGTVLPSSETASLSDQCIASMTPEGIGITPEEMNAILEHLKQTKNAKIKYFNNHGSLQAGLTQDGEYLPYLDKKYLKNTKDSQASRDEKTNKAKEVAKDYRNTNKNTDPILGHNEAIASITNNHQPFFFAVKSDNILAKIYEIVEQTDLMNVQQILNKIPDSLEQDFQKLILDVEAF